MIDSEPAVTRALVLAAGDGTRLRGLAPKPTLEVVGLPLLARTLFTLDRAGITDAYVVLGFEAETVRAAIEGVQGLNLRIHWLQNDLWDEEPNGVSVLAGEPVLDGQFILMMCDHVIDPGILTKLQVKADGFRGIDLAVDFDVERVFDLDDATKVQVAAGEIVEIGKSLATFNAVDAGVFLATPELFEAVREARRDGDASLSQAVQKLADRKMARVTDIGNMMWQDVDTPRDAVEAERKLLLSLRKPSDGPVSKHINRPISVALSKRLANTGITPNQMTFAHLVVGLLSGAVAALGGYVPFLIGGILFQLSSVLDGADGELAKLTFRSSKRGEWFDTVADNVTYLACLIGLTIGVRRANLPDFYFISGLFGFAFALLAFVNLYVYLVRRNESGSLLAVRHGFEDGAGLVSRVLGGLQYLTKRDVFALLILLLAIVGQLPLALPFFAIATLVVLVSSVRLNLMGWGRGEGRSVDLAQSLPLQQTAVTEPLPNRRESVAQRTPVR